MKRFLLAGACVFALIAMQQAQAQSQNQTPAARQTPAQPPATAQKPKPADDTGDMGENPAQLAGKASVPHARRLDRVDFRLQALFCSGSMFTACRGLGREERCQRDDAGKQDGTVLSHGVISVLCPFVTKRPIGTGLPPNPRREGTTGKCLL